MNTILTIFSILLPMAFIMVSAFMIMKMRLQGKNTSRAVKINLASFAVIIVMVGLFTFMASAEEAVDGSAEPTQTEEVVVETESSNAALATGLGLLSAGLVTGFAGIGSGIAIGQGAPAAISANIEDPKSFGKSLIFVALGESIAIFGVVISILILNKV